MQQEGQVLNLATHYEENSRENILPLEFFKFNLIYYILVSTKCVISVIPLPSLASTLDNMSDFEHGLKIKWSVYNLVICCFCFFFFNCCKQDKCHGAVNEVHLAILDTEFMHLFTHIAHDYSKHFCEIMVSFMQP